MIELSIEKAKRYDEAIKKAESLYKAAEPMSGCNVIIETLFPELKESEDERIRGAIIDHLKDNNLTEWAVWLEKQCEHDNFRNMIQIGDKVTRNEDGVLVNLSQLKRVAKKDEKQCEQKPIDNQFTPEQADILDKHIDKFLEQKPIKEHDVCDFCEDRYGCVSPCPTKLIEEEKPTSWSEEDELHIKELESLVKRVWAIAEHENDKDTIHKMSDLSFFLKTLKPQLKQEWSEEDNRHLESILIRLDDVIHNTFTDTCYSINEDVDWLKSLRHQSQWKPSEEQMDMLAKVCSTLHLTSGENEIMESIYDALKKLREE